jgi:hypothetical protein
MDARLVHQQVSVPEFEVVVIVPIQDNQVRGEEHLAPGDLVGSEAIG